MTPELQKSYRHCQQIARAAASNFYWCFRLLPREKHRSMCALYAFSRRADDLGDSHDSSDNRRQALDGWRRTLQQALAGTHTDPMMPALVDTVRRYGVPPECLFQILDGVAMDLEPVEFESFEALQRYCYLVASTVGLACIHIWGFSDPAAQPLAIDTGIAFQLTNILRDIGEDGRRNRLYLPLDELRRFGVNADDLVHGVGSEGLAELMRFQIERAVSYYRRSADLADYLAADGRRVLRLMIATYWQLLQVIRHRDGRVIGEPIRVGRVGRLTAAGSALLPWGAVYRRRFCEAT